MILMMNDSNRNQDNKEQIATVVGCPSAMSDDDNYPSSPESSYVKELDLMTAAMDAEIAAQLAEAGGSRYYYSSPVGVTGAAASKKPKKPHSFETNPAIRKRQQNRLLLKLKQTIDQFATRIGQQAIVLVITPGNSKSSYKVFGAKPLEDVIRNLRGVIMEELGDALAHQAPTPIQEDPTLFELPPLIIDGIPTPVEKLTQGQLRAFIPLMLKYSTGRGQPGWGRQSTKPPWWPKELPWANVRIDTRSKDEKRKVPWTDALRQVVINCYKFHGREDLLPLFSEDDEANATATVNANIPTQYTSTVVHTISNPDGTVSIVQVDPDNPFITLPDGSILYIQEIATPQSEQADGSLTEDGTAEEVVDLNSVI